MKIIEIGCSTEGNSDGIGKHARIVCEEMNRRDGVEATLISGNTVGFSKLGMITSREMNRAFSDARHLVETECYDYVVVEYPFSEYNPWIVMDFRRLKRACHKNGCQLALSMHEYDRVNCLRKMVVRNFLRNADFAYVSETRYLEKLKWLNPNLYLRVIPNHIPLLGRTKDLRTKNHFVYFGLVNKSKAFDEMIRAWNLFNRNGECRLNIVTATDIEFHEREHRNIKLFRGPNDEEVADIMWKSMFSIIPVTPEVGLNNSSFISAIQCGCIPIGRFSEKLRRESFVINLDSYEIEPFEKVLRATEQLGAEELATKSEQARRFGECFTLKSSVDMILKAMTERSV